MPDQGRKRTYDLWNASLTFCQLGYAVRSVRACDIIQIMNVYECNGIPAIASLNGTINLSPRENIVTIARIKTFIICFI